MSLIAGIIWHGAVGARRDEVENTIARSLSRHRGESITPYRFTGAVLFKADVGAYDGPGAYVSATGGVTLVAGNPILPVDGGVASRPDACARLGRALTDNTIGTLRATRGVFSGVHYDPSNGRLTLFGDRLGVRPMYYAVTSEYTIFSTALRVLEAVQAPAWIMDLQGVTEIIALGIPLGTRTAYADIRAIDAAEIVEIDQQQVQHKFYWTWSEVAEAAPSDLPGLGGALFDAFTRAVELRIGTDKSTAAFLSGGLDSRCVVASLANLGVNVNTFMFASELGEERYCATEFAAAMGVTHRIVSDPTFPPKWASMFARAWRAADFGSPDRAEHPQLVWSGDGGSVGLGWVYLSEDLIRTLRAGKRDDAIRNYLDSYGSSIPERLLRTDGVRALANIQRDIASELDRAHSNDPAKSFYFYLLLNDQRRHLAAHYEDIDLHRIEYQLPFFDWDFLTIAASIPADLGLGHRFYTEWLANFPPAVTAVPWQTYPGHVPSGHPIPSGLTNQWDPEVHSARSRRLRDGFSREAKATLLAAGFPSTVIRRDVFALLTAAHVLGVRNYDYAIRAAATFSRYSKLSGGRYRPDVALREE